MFNYFKKMTSGKIAFFLMILIGSILHLSVPEKNWFSAYSNVLLFNAMFISLGLLFGFLSFNIDIDIRLFSDGTSIWYLIIIILPISDLLAAIGSPDSSMMSHLGGAMLENISLSKEPSVFDKYIFSNGILTLIFVTSAPFRRMIRIEKMLKRIDEKSSDSDISK